MSSTDQFFPADATDPAYYAFPQSELFKRIEARDEFERQARGEPEDQDYPVAPYKSLPLFPADAKQLVIWGLDGVLINISPRIESAYKERTAEALRNMLGDSVEVDEATVHRLVHKGYKESGLPCKYVAEQYGVDEGTLQINMLSIVAYKDIALNPSQYGMSDQGLLNYFEASRQQGVVHGVVTSATGNFAHTCMHFSVLSQYMNGIFGSESRRSNSTALLSKNICADEFLDNVLRDVPADRYKDITVADHNLDFLAAAQAKGLKTAFVDMHGIFTVCPSEANVMCKSALGVFKTLGIKDPGSRRDSHVYSGAGGMAISAK